MSSARPQASPDDLDARIQEVIHQHGTLMYSNGISLGHDGYPGIAWQDDNRDAPMLGEDEAVARIRALVLQQRAEEAEACLRIACSTTSPSEIAAAIRAVRGGGDASTATGEAVDSGPSLAGEQHPAPVSEERVKDAMLLEALAAERQAAEAKGFREGAEWMRERCAETVEDLEPESAEAILALPLQPEGDDRE